MTKSSFLRLSLDEQETFINSGGLIQEDTIKQVEIVSSVSPHSDVVGVSGFSPSSTQPAISLAESQIPLQQQNSPQLDKLLSHNNFDGLLIADPVDLLMLVDEEVQLGQANGGVDLALWQVQAMLDFAYSGHNQDNPYQAIFRACNGSGKDKYIIAACAVWVCMRYKNTTCPVTSSSGFQLNTQTCKHTKRLCEAVNRFFGLELWEIIERRYTFRFDLADHQFDSQIVCYATDEPGKAEGFHPIKTGARMAIFLSEDKTIPDEINNAINKCTGYTHRVHASTPGKSFGHFYDYCQMAVDRKSIKHISEVGPTDWVQYHITGAMCPYRGKNARQMAIMNTPGGENSSAFKSQEDAEFGADDGEMVAIPYTYVWQATRNTHNTPWLMSDHNDAGVDLSDGGDEAVLAVRNGNKLLKLIPFTFDNTEDTVAFLVEKFKENQLDNPRSRIWGDCVGMGKPILDRIKRLKWSNIRYFDSRAEAQDKTVYKNRNSESWFKFRKLLEQREIILFQDKILEKQLGTRHYKLMEGNKIHQMLSKVEEKKKCKTSPDRADAVLYCFWGYESTHVEPEVTDENAPFVIPKEDEDYKGDFDMRIWAKGKMEGNKRHNELEDLDDIREELKRSNERRKLTLTER